MSCKENLEKYRSRNGTISWDKEACTVTGGQIN